MGRRRTCRGLYRIITEKLMKGLGIPSLEISGGVGEEQDKSSGCRALTHPVGDLVGEVAGKPWAVGICACVGGAQQLLSPVPRALGNDPEWDVVT